MITKTKILLSFFICNITIALTSFSGQESHLYGMIKLNKQLYYDETEIQVMDWLSYYSWKLTHEGKSSINDILPDSLALEPEIWQLFKNYSTKFNFLIKSTHTQQPIGYFPDSCNCIDKYSILMNHNNKICELYYYPMTGITYEQAIKFCEWRTMLNGDGLIIYRLPTIEESRELAINQLNKDEKLNTFKDSLTKKGCPNYNYKFTSNCDLFVKNNLTKSRKMAVALFNPNRKGFDIFGNISEMTQTKGISKGGNFKLYANQCHPDSVQIYNKPEIWLGFRCVGELVTKPLYIASQYYWQYFKYQSDLPKEDLDFINSRLQEYEGELFIESNYRLGIVCKGNDTTKCKIFLPQNDKGDMIYSFIITKQEDESLRIFSANDIDKFSIDSNSYFSYKSKIGSFFIKLIADGKITLYQRPSIPSDPAYAYFMKIRDVSTMYILKPYQTNLPSEGKLSSDIIDFRSNTINVNTYKVPEKIKWFLVNLPNIEVDLKNKINSGMYTENDIERIVNEYNKK